MEYYADRLRWIFGDERALPDDNYVDDFINDFCYLNYLNFFDVHNFHFNDFYHLIDHLVYFENVNNFHFNDFYHLIDHLVYFENVNNFNSYLLHFHHFHHFHFFHFFHFFNLLVHHVFNYSIPSRM
ncbi:hypothetical protein HDU79_007433 [Rhizoclosmatium sp. JEL0117]|nr:hypothetical protein HDU79_007433 [Rhizoclosmatium sp. JEL0117]